MLSIKFYLRFITMCQPYWLLGHTSNKSTNESWICNRCVGCILILMIVTKLDVIILDAMTLYYKDNGP